MSKKWRARVPYYSYRSGLARGHRRYYLAAILAMPLLVGGAIGVWQANSQIALQDKAKAAAVQGPRQLQIKPVLVSNTNTVARQDARLDGLINAFVAAHSTSIWSVQVQGLGGDDFISSYNTGLKMDAASLFKPLLIYPLAKKLPISQWPGQNLRVGTESISLFECVNKMLKSSDNACGVAVGDYVGWSYANKELAAIGLNNTELNSLSSHPQTTAVDISNYLKQVYGGKLLDKTTRDFLLGALQQQVYRQGIPAGCADCVVADKTASSNLVRHDAAIIESPKADYVLSILTNGAKYSEIAALTAQIQAYLSGL